MLERQRRNEDLPAGAAPAAGGSDNLNRMRQAGEGFLAAGAEAIRGAMSRDSRGFLESNVQKGGQ